MDDAFNIQRTVYIFGLFSEIIKKRNNKKKDFKVVTTRIMTTINQSKSFNKKQIRTPYKQ